MLDIKFGTVEEIDEKKHKVKIREIDTKLVTPFLSILSISAGVGRSFNIPAVGQPVAFILVGDFLGIVLGSFWTKGEFEAGNKLEYYIIRIDANNYIKYNTDNGNYELKTKGSIKLNSNNIELGSSPTDHAMLYEKFDTWASNVETWIKTGVAPSGGGLVTYATPMPARNTVQSQQVKLK